MSIANISSLPALQEIRRGWLEEQRNLAAQLFEVSSSSSLYLELLNKRYQQEQLQRQAHINMLETNLAKLAVDLAELEQRIVALTPSQN